VQKPEIIKAIDDVARIPMAPEHDWTIGGRFNVPTEQSCPVRGLKPYIFKRQPTLSCPISILPWLGVIDEELVKKAHRISITKSTSEKKESALRTHSAQLNESEECLHTEEDVVVMVAVIVLESHCPVLG